LFGTMTQTDKQTNRKQQQDDDAMYIRRHISFTQKYATLHHVMTAPNAQSAAHTICSYQWQDILRHSDIAKPHACTCQDEHAQ
jgi:hypothetical protein